MSESPNEEFKTMILAELTVSGYVVVTFGGAADGWCTLNHCPMSAYGPYETSDEAKAFAATMPAWTQPHILILKTSPE